MNTVLNYSYGIALEASASSLTQGLPGQWAEGPWQPHN